LYQTFLSFKTAYQPKDIRPISSTTIVYRSFIEDIGDFKYMEDGRVICHFNDCTAVELDVDQNKELIAKIKDASGEQYTVRALNPIGFEE
jgi:hypothetical protein